MINFSSIRGVANTLIPSSRERPNTIHVPNSAGQNNEVQPANCQMRDVLLNKSFSFDGLRMTSVRVKEMFRSAHEPVFSYISKNLYDSSSSSPSISSSSPEEERQKQQYLLQASVLTISTDDGRSLASATSRRSQREKVLLRRQKLRNMHTLRSPEDLISSTSSSSEEDNELIEELNQNKKCDPVSLTKSYSKVDEDKLIQAICDMCSDDSSPGSSMNDLRKCRPPSLYDQISSGSSEASVKATKKNVARSNKRFRTPTPRHIRMRQRGCRLKNGPDIMLDATRPPSLMEQISLNSGDGDNSSASSNSLKSVKSEIFDLPNTDAKVNEVAIEVAEGIKELTRSFDSTFPIGKEAAKIHSTGKTSLDGNASSRPSSSCDTTTYSIEPSPVVSSFEADADPQPNRLVIEAPPIPLHDYMKLALTGSFDGSSGEEVDAKSDFGVDDLPTDNTFTLTAGNCSAPEENKTLIDDNCNSSSAGDRSSSYKTCVATAADETSSSSYYYTDFGEDVFNDTPSSEFKSAQDYEKFLLSENAKLIAHTLAEMAYCTTSSATTDDFMSLVSTVSSSRGIRDINDLSLRLTDDEDSRATYNIDSNEKAKQSHDFNLTYKLESVTRIPYSRSTGFVSTAANSSDLTYSLDPPAKEKTASTKIRETRSSILRTERARKVRSMEVRPSEVPKITNCPSMDSRGRPVRRTTMRRTFVKTVKQNESQSNKSSNEHQASSTSTSSGGQFSVKSSQSIPISRSGMGCQVQADAKAVKVRAGVQAKVSAFLQRIRS